MKKLLFLIAFLTLSIGLKAQTHVFCPTDLNCTWTGDQTFSGKVILTSPTDPLQLGPAGVKFNDGTTQTTAGGGSGSGIFSSFQFGSNPAITSNGNYFRLLPGTGSAFQYSGNGTIANPFLATINNINTPSGVNGLISGGYIFYTGSGYTYTVSKATYQIGGVVYNSPQSDITLTAADPTFNRIDTVFANNSGTVGVITGTPSANPVTPTVDPTTQIFLGYITVTAGTTSPAGITTTNVYLENAGPPGEWACAATSSWTCADTVKPFAGSFDISSDGSSVVGTTTLTVSPAVSLSSYNIIAFQLATNGDWTPQDNLWITFYNGSAVVGNSVVVNNNYGWDGKASSYELVVLPLSIFSLSSNSVTSMQLKWNRGGTQTNNITIHIDNVKLQQSQVGGQQNLSSITGMIGDGVVYNTTVPVVNNQLAPQLANANVGYFLRGPTGQLGSNVAVRQRVLCSTTSASTTATYTCPTFPSPVAVGDKILIISANQSGAPGGTFSDTQGNTITANTTTGSGSLQRYGFGSVTNGGIDQITITGATYFTNTGGVFYYSAFAVELTGTSSVTSAQSKENAGGATSQTVAVTAGAATDSFIRFSIFTSGTTTTCTGSTTLAPVGSTLNIYSSANLGIGFGISDIFAPGSTASTSNVASYNVTSCGGAGGQIQEFTVIDLAQSASAGSSPWAAGPITEGDLPASAISAIQSVAKFNVTSNTNLPSNTNTTILSPSITMPSDGCPCRVFVNYSAYEAVGGSGTVTSWVNDGTVDGATMQANTTDATSMPIVNMGWFGPYANNQSVTFTWKVNPGTYATGTYQINTGFAASTSSESGHMTLTVMQSRN